MNSSNKILIVIPAHNEEETIFEVVTKALAYADVSVTDDGSRDKTPHILSRIKDGVKTGRYKHHLHIITHPTATHIPQGIQDGLKYGIQLQYDFIVTMDAGLSHKPEALPDFINYNNSVDVVIGNRRNLSNVPFYRKIISRLAGLVVNYSLTSSYFNFFGSNIRDCTSGYRRYSRRAAKAISDAALKSKSFDFHMESLAICVRSGMKVTEIPIDYVFSNSSFNAKVLKQGIRFGLYLIGTKTQNIP